MNLARPSDPRFTKLTALRRKAFLTLSFESSQGKHHLFRSIWRFWFLRAVLEVKGFEKTRTETDKSRHFWNSETSLSFNSCSLDFFSPDLFSLLSAEAKCSKPQVANRWWVEIVEPKPQNLRDRCETREGLWGPRLLGWIPKPERTECWPFHSLELYTKPCSDNLGTLSHTY